MIKKFGSLVLASLAVVVGEASWSAGIDDLLFKMGKGNAKIYKEFDTELGLKGYVLALPNNAYSVAFSDKDETFLMAGFVMDHNGVNVAKKYYDQYVPKPDYLGELSGANLVTVGKADAPHVFYVAAEPNCGYCKRLHADLEPYVRRGELAVKWMLVGFNDSGAEKAAYALGSKQPAVTLGQLFAGDAGGSPDKESLTKIEENKDVFNRLSIKGTPFIAFRALNGNVQTIPGAVSGDKLAELIKVAGR